MSIADTQTLIKNLSELVEQAKAEVEMISDETEEVQMLKKSFGGIAAILRFKLD